MSAWADLFPADDFGFRLTLRRGDPAEFFAPSSDSVEILGERREALAVPPTNYAVVAPEGESAWEEFVQTAGQWTTSVIAIDPIATGGQHEPDVVLLCRDGSGIFRVAGGVMVFPSHWSLPEKIGLNPSRSARRRAGAQPRRRPRHRPLSG